ncbi:hypothetical protein GGH95_003417, partial [Coemansia sp. RSA 1836]
ASQPPLVTLVVWFPERKVCEDCYDYQEITVYAFDNTVRQIKSIIATCLGIEADEFVFFDPDDSVNSKSGMEKSFAESFLSSEA